MGENTKQASGFTLVEISIVMIIIGLLIGGTFGGIKLVENMQVNKTVQDLKAIESAALTFKDTYGRLPGDMPNTAARLPNCTVAPCATGGNGDRRLDVALGIDAAIANTNERFTFWSHLQAADLVSLGIRNTTDMSFGEGQPEAAIGGGIRVTNYDGGLGFCGTQSQVSLMSITGFSSSALNVADSVSCSNIESVDRKMDDGIVSGGNILGQWGCESAASCSAVYLQNSTGRLTYNARF
jgi:prepilin-type N-terminal cleavage/methylation domain-containing protein